MSDATTLLSQKCYPDTKSLSEAVAQMRYQLRISYFWPSWNYFVRQGVYIQKWPSSAVATVAYYIRISHHECFLHTRAKFCILISINTYPSEIPTRWYNGSSGSGYHGTTIGNKLLYVCTPTSCTRTRIMSGEHFCDRRVVASLMISLHMLLLC